MVNLTNSTAQGNAGYQLGTGDAIFYSVLVILGFVAVYKIISFFMKRTHIDYMKNVREKFISDCMANLPNDVDMLASSYLSLPFGKIVGWLPRGISTQKKKVDYTDAKGKIKTKTISVIPKNIQDIAVKSKLDIKTVHFFAIIPDWAPFKVWFIPLHKFPMIGNKLNIWWNYRKEIKLVIVPHNMLKDPYKLKGNIYIKAYALGTIYGGFLTPTNNTIDMEDFTKFVNVEFATEMREDILEHVGDIVDNQREMLGTDEFIKGILSKSIPKDVNGEKR